MLHYINKFFFSLLTSLTSKTEKIQKHVFIFDKFVPFAILYYIFFVRTYFQTEMGKKAQKDAKIKCKSKNSPCAFFSFFRFHETI